MACLIICITAAIPKCRNMNQVVIIYIINHFVHFANNNASIGD